MTLIVTEQLGTYGDKLAALELGISVEKYQALRQAYIETYDVVTPIEGKTKGKRRADGVIEAENAYIPSKKGWKHIRY